MMLRALTIPAQGVKRAGSFKRLKIKQYPKSINAISMPVTIMFDQRLKESNKASLISGESKINFFMFVFLFLPMSPLLRMVEQAALRSIMVCGNAPAGQLR